MGTRTGLSAPVDGPTSVPGPYCVCVKWFRFPRLIGVVVAVYMVAIALLFARLSMDNHAFRGNATSTEGTVVALVPRAFSGSPRVVRQGRGVPLAPQIQYAVAGTTYTYTPSQGSYKPRVAVGDHLTILYDPDNPGDSAQLKGEGRVLLPVVTVGFGLVAVGVVIVLVRTRRIGANAGSRAHPSLPHGAAS